MKKINAKNLYLEILNKLEDCEIAKPDPLAAVLFTKFYDNLQCEGNDIKVCAHSIAEFLLRYLGDKWGEMITIEELEWQLKLATSTPSKRRSTMYLKYWTLFDLLKEGAKE